jgi:hypothetical protein
MSKEDVLATQEAFVELAVEVPAQQQILDNPVPASRVTRAMIRDRNSAQARSHLTKLSKFLHIEIL